MIERTLQAAVSRSNIPTTKNLDFSAEEGLQASNQWTGRTGVPLEVSWCGLWKSPDGSRLGSDLGLLVLWPDYLSFVMKVGVFKKRLEAAAFEYGDFSGARAEEQEFGTEGKTGEYAIQFYKAGSVPFMRFEWNWWRRGFDATEVKVAAARERNRVLAALPARLV